MSTLSAEHLRKVLSYDMDTGRFARLASTTRTDLIGCIAGSPQNNGYIAIHISGRLYLAHRLAFLYVNGKWPDDEVDHINGDRKDNRWSNLRNASHSQNCQNAKSKGRSLPKGVELATEPRRRKRYFARIMANGKRYSLGYFYTPEEAHAAYMAAAVKRHGEFARTE